MTRKLWGRLHERQDGSYKAVKIGALSNSDASWNWRVTDIYVDECASASEPAIRQGWDVDDLLSRPAAGAGEALKRCSNCDDTGQVTSITGEWHGRCHCEAGRTASPMFANTTVCGTSLAALAARPVADRDFAMLRFPEVYGGRPVADGEAGLPPLPEHRATTVGIGRVWNAEDMHAYARAALARQAPPAYEGTSERWRTVDIHARQAPAPLSQAVPEGIERDESIGRDYIPLPGGWEVQTKGNGSMLRILDKKSGERHPLPVLDFVVVFIERMAREIHSAWRHPQPQAVTEDARDGELLAWLAANVDMDLDWGAPDGGDEEDECVWRVYQQCGGRNDREWRFMGQGDTPSAALIAARRAQTSSGKGDGRG